MNTQELTALLDRLRAEPHETEWLEFKANRFEPQLLGEYLSALANSTYLLGKPCTYLVFGIEDSTHAVVGNSLNIHNLLRSLTAAGQIRNAGSRKLSQWVLADSTKNQ